MSNLTQEAISLINVMFPEDKQLEIKNTLEDFYKTLLTWGIKEENNRIYFAILKLSLEGEDGNINKFHKAIEMARFDYRDLLAAAGFENDSRASLKAAGFGDDTTSYEKWFNKMKVRKNLTSITSKY